MEEAAQVRVYITQQQHKKGKRAERKALLLGIESCLSCTYMWNRYRSTSAAAAYIGHRLNPVPICWQDWNCVAGIIIYKAACSQSALWTLLSLSLSFYIRFCSCCCVIGEYRLYSTCWGIDHLLLSLCINQGAQRTRIYIRIWLKKKKTDCAASLVIVAPMTLSARRRRCRRDLEIHRVSLSLLYHI